MNYKRFIEVTQKHWTEYFNFIKGKSSEGLMSSNKRETLFPTILLITQSKNRFIAELLGASKEFQGLSFKYHNELSVNRYLGQFGIDNSYPLIGLNGENIQVQDLVFTQHQELAKIQSRFPITNSFKTIIHAAPNSIGSMIAFGDNFKSVEFNNCLLINSYTNIVRIKHILNLIIVQDELSALDYEQWMKQFLYEKKVDGDGGIYREVKGVHTCNQGKEHDVVIAGQFASTFLFNKLRETTIGEFIKLHPEIIQRAIGERNFEYEPEFPWLEANSSNTDKFINPDLMIEREDGYYDIYDLKTAVLDKENITKGQRRRRRFIDYVEEGVAQLANYAEYFTFSKNCEYALKRYKIKVKNPNLILVVGNYDNVNKTEVEEACRRLNSNISIIDYDSLLQMFLLSGN